MIETSVRYVRIHTSVNVLRIDATAIAIGIATAGSVPKTKKRITSAPRPAINASVRMLGPLPPDDASSSGSRPVRLAVTPGGVAFLSAARVSLMLVLAVEARYSGWVDRREGRVPVLRDVHRVAGGEERRRARAGIRPLRCRHRAGDAALLRHVAGAVEDRDERRLLARSEDPQRLLARLVRRSSRESRTASASASKPARRRSRRRA